MKKPVLTCFIMLTALLAGAGCAGQEASKTPLIVPQPLITSPSQYASSAGTTMPAYWTQTYRNEGENDSVVSILPSADNGFLLVGLEGHHSEAESLEIYRTYLVKTDAAGQQIWKKYLDDYQSLKQVRAALKTGEVEYVILETHMVHPDNVKDYRYELVLIKVNDSGEKLWSNIIQTEINAYQISLNLSSSGFVICGAAFSGTDFEVLEIGSGGNVIQRRTLPLPVSGTDYQNIVMRATAGGDFLFAAKKITGERQSVLSAVRTDRDGRVIWNRTCEDPGFQLSPEHILETSDGGIMITGSAGATTEMIRPWAYLHLVRLDYSGNQLWNLTWGDKNYRFTAAAVSETGDGGYLIAGQKSLLIPMPGTAFILRTDKMGKELWSRTFSDLSGVNKIPGAYVRSQADSILPVSGGFLVSGEYGNFPSDPPDRDIFFMKINMQGNLDLQPLGNLRPDTVAPSEAPENTIVRTLPVNQAVTVNGITLTLEKFGIRGKGFSFNALYTPPDFNPAAPLPSSIPGALAVYSLDGGQEQELPVPPFSLDEKGIRYSWISGDPVPPGTKEMTIRITGLGTQPGPWEFKVEMEE